MKLNDKTYDTLKWVAQIVIPSLGTLYFGLASIWGLPYGEQVVGTLTVIDAFLGALLGVSTSSFHKDGADGILHIDTSNEEVDKYKFEITNFDALESKEKLMIKVNKT